VQKLVLEKMASNPSLRDSVRKRIVDNLQIAVLKDTNGDGRSLNTRERAYISSWLVNE